MTERSLPHEPPRFPARPAAVRRRVGAARRVRRLTASVLAAATGATGALMVLAAKETPAHGSRTSSAATGATGGAASSGSTGTGATGSTGSGATGSTGSGTSGSSGSSNSGGGLSSPQTVPSRTSGTAHATTGQT